MAKSESNPKVESYLRGASAWQNELATLRMILRGTPLTEEFKWGAPCYTFQGRNVVLVHAFKNYCALLFFKGALLRDANGILIQQTENTQAARQIRFTNVREIVAMKSTLKAYISEAIVVEKAGLRVKFKRPSEMSIPQEFRARLEGSAALKTAFGALTPGRQRAYILYFSAPKQSKTRASRVEKCARRILNGMGLHD